MNCSQILGKWQPNTIFMKLTQGSQGVKRTSDEIRHRWNWIGRTYEEKIERSNAFNIASDWRPEENGRPDQPKRTWEKMGHSIQYEVPPAPSVLRSFEFYPLEHGTKKKSESPTGIKPVTPQTPDRHSIHWATRTQGKQGHLTEFICDRRPGNC